MERIFEWKLRYHAEELGRRCFRKSYPCFGTTFPVSLSVGLSAHDFMKDRRSGEHVAIKIIPKGRLRPDQLERIRREYSIMNQVPHLSASVSKVYSQVQKGGIPQASHPLGWGSWKPARDMHCHGIRSGWVSSSCNWALALGQLLLTKLLHAPVICSRLSLAHLMND